MASRQAIGRADAQRLRAPRPGHARPSFSSSSWSCRPSTQCGDLAGDAAVTSGKPGTCSVNVSWRICADIDESADPQFDDRLLNRDRGIGQPLLIPAMQVMH